MAGGARAPPKFEVSEKNAEMDVLSAPSNEGFVLHACMLNNQHDLLIIMGTQLSLSLTYISK